MIYFLQSLAGGPVKIGFTEDLDSRVRQLESHYCQSLAILATLPGGRDEERAIHERFSALRIGRTEQFQPGPDLMAFIGRPLFVSANPDTVEAMACFVKPMILQVRGSEEFKVWFEELARFDGLTPTGVFDRAVRKYAKEVGFIKEPPKR